MFDNFRNCKTKSAPHQVRCADSSTKAVNAHQSDTCLTCRPTALAISRTVFKLWHSNVFVPKSTECYRDVNLILWIGRLMHGMYYICSCSFRLPWTWCKVIVGRQRQNFSPELSRQVSKQQATTVGLFYVTLTLKTFIWFHQLVLSVVTALFLGGRKVDNPFDENGRR